jgi:hypothetical protein
MSIDCEENREGIYIAYANNFCSAIADGRTALFGLMNTNGYIVSGQTSAAGITDRLPPW